MAINNKLDKMFGPAGSSAGLFIFITGAVFTYFSLTGAVLIVIGAFVGFTYTSALIDLQKRRLKYSTNLFGFIPVGKWILIKQDMKIVIKKSNITWTAYSKGNRALDLSENDFRLFIYDANGNEIMPVLKADSLESAKSNLEKLNKELGLVIS